MKIISKDGLVKYISTKLGGQYYEIEITPEQYELIIDDTLELYQRYAIGEGSILSYGMLQLEKGRTVYKLRNIDNVLTQNGQRYAETISTPDLLFSPVRLLEDASAWEDTEIDIEWVVSLKDISNGVNNIALDNFGSPINGWLNNIKPTEFSSSGFMGGVPSTGTGVAISSPGAYGGSSASGPFGSISTLKPMEELQWSMSYLELLEQYTNKMYETHWRPQQGILTISPTPTTNSYVAVTYYKREQAIPVYNNPNFKQLVLAEALIQWGDNLGLKYEIPLIGGGTIKADAIRDRGIQQKADVLEKIRGESQPSIFFIM